MVCKTLETAHATVCQLVADFAANEAHFLSQIYSEAQARLDFIDKLWAALGWDVVHEHQKNPYAQEVKVENRQLIGGSQRRADYAFHTAPNFRDPRFFCEAKKPNPNLHSDADAAFQTVRYGYSAGTRPAVLTDFKQTHILDCRAKPDIDTALARSHRAFQYKEWLNNEKFAEFYYIFSREAFASGAFDEYVRLLPKPNKVGRQLGLFRTGHEQVGIDFLNDLERYRADLAALLKAADHSLDGDDLTSLVQRILDRLVFLRFLEDKLIETEIQVSHFARAAGGLAWTKFLAASRTLNTRYNGIVFRFHDQLDKPGALPVDEGRFGDLCEELCHTRSPYDFNAIPIHILGSIYERFLGKIIVTTEARSRVVEKPELRKAGGVYYTPEYIVRYICANTIGSAIKNKSPAQITKLRFADIACGSGSFLLGTYDLLLRHHELWYNQHPAEAHRENLSPSDKNKKRKKEVISAVVERDGALVLTLEKKRDILLNNIFGVDLDPQAVEVAQLSLYLKLLEDETTATARQHYLDFHEALLPSLSTNIKCGNSLIGTDVLFGKFDFSTREERKLGAMDFETSFHQLLTPGKEKDGIFDVIIGNPPYRREKDFKHLLDQIAACNFGAKFRAPRMDLWYYFVHKALSLLKRSGLLSYIVNAYWTSGTGAHKLITALGADAHLDELFVLGKLKVFENVSGQHMIFRASLPPGTSPVNVRIAQRTDEASAEPFFNGKSIPIEFTKPHGAVFRGGIVDFEPDSGGILDKLESNPILATFGRIRQGIAENPSSINKKTIERFHEKWVVGEGVFTLTPQELSRLKLNSEERRLVRPYYDLCDIGRYSLKKPSLRLIYSSKATWATLNEYPNLRDHLARFRRIMEERRETVARSNQWWHLHWPREEAIWKADKILSVQMGKRPIFFPAFGESYVSFSVNVFVPNLDTRLSLDYITGLLNSKVLYAWFKHRAKKRGANLEINGNVLQRAPIRTLDLSKPHDGKQHDRMVELVKAMVSAHEQAAIAKNEGDHDYCIRKAAGIDRKIDELTCELYHLTPEESAIVLGSDTPM